MLATVLQVVGAVAFVVMGFLVAPAVGFAVVGVVLVLAGLIVERGANSGSTAPPS